MHCHLLYNWCMSTTVATVLFAVWSFPFVAVAVRVVSVSLRDRRLAR